MMKTMVARSVARVALGARCAVASQGATVVAARITTTAQGARAFLPLRLAAAGLLVEHHQGPQHSRMLHTTTTLHKKKGKGHGHGSKAHKPAMTFDPSTAPMDVEKMEQQFVACEEALTTELGKIRTGQVSPGILDAIPFVRQVGQVSVKNANTLLLTTFDQESAKKALEAIKDSGIAQNPIKNGLEIEIVLPRMTTEYKEKLQKLAKDSLEKLKTQARNTRNKYVSQVKKSDATKDDKRHIETYIQQLMDMHIKNMEEAFEAKRQSLS